MQRHLDGVMHDALDRGVPRWLAEEAALITMERLGFDEDSGRAGGTARVRGYFWGIVRNRCLESRDRRLDSLAERFVHASVIADVQAAGGAVQVFERTSEVCRAGLSARVPAQLELAL
ncbi:MAG: hypothetical protein OEV43_02715 [Coriobacteriia bacterium]|nr:hypothetical protein [Coriobacteriia bacterium]